MLNQALFIRNEQEAIVKIVDNVQGQGANGSADLVAGQFKNGADTFIFEYFESVWNKALETLDAFLRSFQITSEERDV
jgi:hypothetical protein